MIVLPRFTLFLIKYHSAICLHSWSPSLDTEDQILNKAVTLSGFR